MHILALNWIGLEEGIPKREGKKRSNRRNHKVDGVKKENGFFARWTERKMEILTFERAKTGAVLRDRDTEEPRHSVYQGTNQIYAL